MPIINIGYKKFKKINLLPPYFIKKYYFCRAVKTVKISYCNGYEVFMQKN